MEQGKPQTPSGCLADIDSGNRKTIPLNAKKQLTL
jgi:hypothetical protein